MKLNVKKVVRFSISWKNVIGISIFLMVIGCSKHIYEVAYPTLVDGKYDTEFPYKECADQLNDISQTIKQINYIAYYKSYQFNTESNVLISTVSDAIDKDILIMKYILMKLFPVPERLFTTRTIIWRY